EHIIRLLSLENIHIYDYDWRTFLRAAPVDSIDYFVARASLRPDELIRAFSPGCAYKGATAIYWAASDWQAEGKEGGFVARQVPYQVGNRERKLVFLKGS